MKFMVSQVQKVTGGYRVVVYSEDNGKLILWGETLKRRADAMRVADDVQWYTYVNRSILQTDHKWPRNAGPKKKSPTKKKK